MSIITLYSTLNTLEIIRDRGLIGSKGPTINRKWTTGNQMVMWPMTSRDLKLKLVSSMLRAQYPYLENSWSSNRYGQYGRLS